MHGRLEAVESVLSGRRATQQKKTIFCTWNYGYGYGIYGIYCIYRSWISKNYGFAQP